MLAGILIREWQSSSLTAKLTGGISGGMEIIFFTVAIILLLANTGGHWTMIIGSILAALVLIVGVVPGILSLILIGNSHTLGPLIKANKTLIGVFLICFISLGLISLVLNGIQLKSPIETILVGALSKTAESIVVTIYLFLLGIGFVEIFKSALSYKPR
jgi:hypothetical protein